MSSERLYKTIYGIAKVINSSLDPSKVNAGIAEEAARAMEAKGCFIRVLDRTGNILRPDAYYGLSERYAQKGPVEVEKSLLDQDVLRGEIVTIPDVRTDNRFQYGEEAAKEGLVSLLVVPLTARGGKVVGVLRIYSGEPREFTTDELDFLTCIANLSGIAMENARMYQALKRTSELAEAYVYQTFDD